MVKFIFEFMVLLTIAMFFVVMYLATFDCMEDIWSEEFEDAPEEEQDGVNNGNEMQ